MQQILTFMLNHWALWVSLLILLLLIFINELHANKVKPKGLIPAEAIEKINHQEAIVIDIREPDVFKAGHIIDAKCMASKELTQSSLAKFKEKPIILVCAQGITASALATELKNKGIENLFVLQGGMKNWTESGLPTVKGKSS